MRVSADRIRRERTGPRMKNADGIRGERNGTRRKERDAEKGTEHGERTGTKVLETNNPPGASGRWRIVVWIG